jgi:hypothetical protein
VPWPCFFNLQTQCPLPVKAKALQCTPGILGLKSLAPSFVITIGLHWCIHGNIITQFWLSKHPSSNVNCNNNGTAMTPLMNISVLQLVASLWKLSTFLRDKIALTHGLGCPKFYMSICTFLVRGSILIIPSAHSCLLCLISCFMHARMGSIAAKWTCWMPLIFQYILHVFSPANLNSVSDSVPPLFVRVISCSLRPSKAPIPLQGHRVHKNKIP